MESTNIGTRYDLPAFGWDEVRTHLEGGIVQGPGSGAPDHRTVWLSTVNDDGSPHVTGVGSVFVEGTFWIVSGLGVRKGRNMRRDPRVALSLTVPGIDLVVEGRAELVTDAATVARLAEHYRTNEGWPAVPDASGTAFTAPFSAPSAGPAPWHLFRVEVTSAHAVKAVDPGGAMRWRF